MITAYVINQYVFLFIVKLYEFVAKKLAAFSRPTAKEVEIYNKTARDYFTILCEKSAKLHLQNNPLSLIFKLTWFLLFVSFNIISIK